MIGIGFVERPITDNEARLVLNEAMSSLQVDGKRVLILIPDSTRTAPIPFFFEAINTALAPRAASLTYLIALGTHPPMSPEAIERLVGFPAEVWQQRWSNVRVMNHAWQDPAALATIGVLTASEMQQLTEGLMPRETPVRINRQVLENDLILVCGPVFPHEVVGFSGGAKYLFPGIAGAEIIDSTHWLGALVTSFHTIGVIETPVRRVIHAAAAKVMAQTACIAFAMQGNAMHGLYIGEMQAAWRAAANLSARLNILTVPHPFQTVLSCPPPMYDELWTAAKAAYKTEPAVADGGEIIIYAPHLKVISLVHGAYIRRVGYHVRDYFVNQMERFTDVPLGVLAHSTHVRGLGTYEKGVEQARIQVTLATGIPEDVCRLINLGYRDPASINPNEFTGREQEGILYVPHAGEQLYRCPELTTR